MACAEDKIMNPKTGRCVNIGGGVFKNLIKDETIVFTAEDKKKIKDAGYIIVKASPVVEVPKEDLGMDPIKKTKSVGPKSKDMELIDKVPKKIENKVKKHLKHIEGLKNINYLDDGHKEFCKSNKTNKIKIPLLKNTISYQIPYSISSVRNHGGFLYHLDSPKIPYTSGFQKEIKIEFNNYNKEVALQLFKKQDFEIDYDWFKEMDDYITKLSTYDAFTVLGYSYHSFNFINSYLIGNMTEQSLNKLLQDPLTYNTYYFPFYMQAFKLIDKQNIVNRDVNVNYKNKYKRVSEWISECKKLGLEKAYPIFMNIMQFFTYEFWKKVMELVRTDFQRIIDNAPPVKKETVVYRGVKDDYFMKGSEDNYYNNTSFVSCTFDPNHALKYLRNEQCCFKRITLLPGTKVLFISGLSCYPLELEIVINVDSIIFITEKITTNIYKDSTYDIKDDMCFTNNKRKVDIAEIVVVV